MQKRILGKILFLLTSVLLLGSKVSEPNYKLIVFEGSDWCTNCRRLEKQILSKEELKNFLKESSIELEKIDFPQRKKLPKETVVYNESIAEKYGFDGTYPTVLLLNKRSSRYVKLTQYTNQSVGEFCDMISQELQALE